jgi:hypothetical protein
VSEVVRPYNFRLEPRFVRITKDDVLNRERVDPLDGFGATPALASAPPAMHRKGGRRDQSDGDSRRRRV